MLGLRRDSLGGMVSAKIHCGKLVWLVLALLLMLPLLLGCFFAGVPLWLLLLQSLLSALAFGLCLMLVRRACQPPAPAVPLVAVKSPMSHADWLASILPLWRENLLLAVLHSEHAGRQLGQHLMVIHTLLHSIQNKAVDEPVSRVGVHLARLAESASQLEVLCSRGAVLVSEDQRQGWLGELHGLACRLQQDARHARQSLLPLQAAISQPDEGWPQPFFNTLQQASAALQQALVELQAEDRVSQIIAQVAQDQQALQDFLQDHPAGMNAEELENWLSRFRASYTTDEQRAMAMVSTNIKPGRHDDDITYF